VRRGELGKREKQPQQQQRTETPTETEKLNKQFRKQNFTVHRPPEFPNGTQSTVLKKV